jgi:hypothetical protein
MIWINLIWLSFYQPLSFNNLILYTFIYILFLKRSRLSFEFKRCSELYCTEFCLLLQYGWCMIDVKWCLKILCKQFNIFQSRLELDSYNFEYSLSINVVRMNVFLMFIVCLLILKRHYNNINNTFYWFDQLLIINIQITLTYMYTWKI